MKKFLFILSVLCMVGFVPTMYKADDIEISEPYYQMYGVSNNFTNPGLSVDSGHDGCIKIHGSSVLSSSDRKFYFVFQSKNGNECIATVGDGLSCGFKLYDYDLPITEFLSCTVTYLDGTSEQLECVINNDEYAITIGRCSNYVLNVAFEFEYDETLISNGQICVVNMYSDNVYFNLQHTNYNASLYQLTYGFYDEVMFVGEVDTPFDVIVYDDDIDHVNSNMRLELWHEFNFVREENIRTTVEGAFQLGSQNLDLFITDVMFLDVTVLGVTYTDYGVLSSPIVTSGIEFNYNGDALFYKFSFLNYREFDAVILRLDFDCRNLGGYNVFDSLDNDCFMLIIGCFSATNEVYIDTDFDIDIGDNNLSDLPNLDEYLPSNDDLIVRFLGLLYSVDVVRVMMLSVFTFGVVGYVFFGKR